MKIDIRNNAVAGVVEQVFVGISFLIFYGVLIRYFGAEEVGVLSLLLVLTTVGTLGNVGFGSAISHFIPLFEARGIRLSTARYLETAVVCTVGLYLVVLGAAVVPFTMLMAKQVGADHAPVVVPLMVPTVLYVLFLGAGATTSAALTALHRNDLRLWASMAGAVASLAITIVAAPHFGIVAGAWGLAAQAGVILIANWAMLCRLLEELSPVPWKFTASAARDLLSLGSKMQAQSLLSAGVEPITRLLLAQFGPLDAVTYFSMAGRFVLQMRSLIFASAQPLLGAFSHLKEVGTADYRQLYDNAVVMSGFAALVVMSGTAASSPFVGEFWIGTRQPSFVVYALILAAGWAVNAMTLVAYFNTFALGRMKWNLIGHGVLFFLNLGLGPMLGALFGALGVVAAMSAALAISAMVFEFGNARYAPGVTQVSLRVHGLLAISAILAAGVAVFSYDWMRTSIGLPSIVAGLLIGVIWLMVIAPAALAHPARRMFVTVLKR
jgi:O-antigen/teichoic acid export membrane protein